MPRRTHPPKRRRAPFTAHTNTADDGRPARFYVVSTPARSPNNAPPRTPKPTPAPAVIPAPRPALAPARTVRAREPLPDADLHAALAERIPRVTAGHLAFARTVEAIVLTELSTRTRTDAPAVNYLRQVVERDRQGASSSNGSAVVTAVIQAHLRQSP